MDISTLNAMIWTIDFDIISRLVLFAIESQYLVDHCISTFYVELYSAYQLVHFVEQLDIDFTMSDVP